MLNFLIITQTDQFSVSQISKSEESESAPFIVLLSIFHRLKESDRAIIAYIE
jgi:hypothetical protein